MAMFQLFTSTKHHHPLLPLLTRLRSISSSQSLLSDNDDALVTSAVSILKHHRSNNRWSHLRSVLKSNTLLTSSQFSEIAIQLRNNAHLTHNFFHFTVQHSLCSHTLFSYSTVIHILSRSRLTDKALTLIKSVMCVFPSSDGESIGGPVAILDALMKTYRACDSAPFVFDLLVKACLESKKIDVSLEIYEKLKSKNVCLRTSTCNSLIELVCKGRGGFEGYSLYRKMFDLDVGNTSSDRKGVKVVNPSVDTLNIVMHRFYREGLVDKVEEVWEEMEMIGCVPNLYSYNVLMATYCDLGRMEECMRVWQDIENEGLLRDAVTYDTIIGGFCGIGKVGKAEEIYREMVMKGMESTRITFEHLITGHCEIGDVDSAMLFYEDMRRKGFSPGSLTINSIVGSLCDKNHISAAAEFCKTEVKKHDTILEKRNYESLVRGLCQLGKMEEALRFQVEMVRNGFEPDSEIYNAFIDGYMKQGDETMADKVRKEMMLAD